MSTRLLPALLAAILISGAFTFFLSRKMPKANTAVSTPMRRVVAASRAIAPGEVLTAGTLQMSSWPAAQPPPEAFTALGDVTGRAVLYPLSPGEPVLAHQLAAAGAGFGLVARIPDGMRALSVRADEVTGVAGFLMPGSLVDVLVTYKPANAPDSTTTTVLQSVRVLAVGQNSDPTPDAKPTTAGTVTVLVSPRDAERLTLAASLGRIVFVLRNGLDHGGVPSLAASTMFDPPTIAPPAHPAAVRVLRVAPSRPQESFSMQIVSGDKQREETFASSGGK